MWVGVGKWRDGGGVSKGESLFVEQFTVSVRYNVALPLEITNYRVKCVCVCVCLSVDLSVC